MAERLMQTVAAQVAKPGIAAVSKTAGRKAAQVQILPWALDPWVWHTRRIIDTFRSRSSCRCLSLSLTPACEGGHLARHRRWGFDAV